MNQALVDGLVHAVLYEGYMLYPYRPSLKNRQRWTFGGLFPRSYCEVHESGDTCLVQTECLVEGGEDAVLSIKVGFLHLISRLIGEVEHPQRERPEQAEPRFHVVDKLQVGKRLLQTWQEAVERECVLPDLKLAALATEPTRQVFAFPSNRQVEPVRGPLGTIDAVIVRQQQEIAGSIAVSAQPVVDGLFKIRVRVENSTPLGNAVACNREEAQLHALVSTHTVLGVRDGAFISQIDPPEERRALAESCQNVGTWPVLVGEPGARDTLLSVPIILYDYPQIAAESPGDLFDSTEIDEILTLRILTLTDEEKLAMASVDERARALLQRTESLGQEQLMRLHGATRQLQPIPAEDEHE